MNYKITLCLSYFKGYNKRMSVEKTMYREFLTKEEAKKQGGELCYKKWTENHKNILLNEMDYDHNENSSHDIIELYCGYTYKRINNYLRNKKSLL